jgi:two-component system NarL family sensor kinase
MATKPTDPTAATNSVGVVSGDVELGRVLQQHRLRSFRIGSALRVGVVLLMVGAMLVGTARGEWPAQILLLAAYGLVAIWAVIGASWPARFLAGRRP